jgi:hypothetical protein
VVEIKKVVLGKGPDDFPASYWYIVTMPDGTERELRWGQAYAPGSRLKILYTEQRGQRGIKVLAAVSCEKDCATPSAPVNEKLP